MLLLCLNSLLGFSDQTQIGIQIKFYDRVFIIRQKFPDSSMAREELMLQFLHCSLLLSAVAALVVGWYTNWSVKKMVVTYGAGATLAMFIAVPDWEFFNRPISEWSIPMASDPQSAIIQRERFKRLAREPDARKRLNFYPLRITLFISFYSFIFYKVWNFVMK